MVIIGFFVVAALGGLLFFATFNGFGGNKNQIGTVVIWGTLPQASVQAAIDDLNSVGGASEYSKVSYAQKPEQSFGASLAEALASGVGPDAVIISQEDIASQAGKLRTIPFTSLPKRTFTDSYLPEFELYLTADGTYGIPLVLDPLVLYWNRSILGSAGIAAAPTTWEAVTGLASTVTKRASGGVITRSLIPLGGYANIGDARAVLSLLLLQAGTPISQQTAQGIHAVFGDESQTTFGSTAAQSAVNFYAQFADPAKTVYSWNLSLPYAQSAFVAGDVALYPGYASERGFLSDANPNLDFDMAPIPQPGTSASRTTYGKAYALAIPKASGNAAGAYLVGLALSGKDSVIARSLGAAPARRSAVVPDTKDRYEPVFYPEALIAKGWLSPAPSAVDAVFSAMIDNVITGRKRLDDAVAAASQAMTAAY